MKRIVSIFLLSILSKYSSAQNVGIGTATPKAILHVADSNVVFSSSVTGFDEFGLPPITGPGRRLMWYPGKGSFRVGRVLHNEWNKDSIGMFSFAAGSNVKAKGYASLAIGSEAEAWGEGAIALGYRSKAKNNHSFASGYEAEALGSSSFVLGPFATALALHSMALGSGSETQGEYSTAIGGATTHGDYSIALGGTRTVAYRSVALGWFNDTLSGSNRKTWISTDPLFMIGNGINTNSRSNALLILKNGNTGFGTSSIQAKLHIAYNSGATLPQLLLEETANDYVRLSFKNSSSNNVWTVAANPQVAPNSAQMNFYYQAVGDIFKLYGTGDAWLKGTLTQNSDSRLKKNIEPLTDALKQLQQINGYRYHWKEASRDSSLQLGVLAQEVQAVFPELVKEDDKGILSVNYNGLIPILINAIKEETEQREKLQLENVQLVKRLEALEKIVLHTRQE